MVDTVESAGTPEQRGESPRRVAVILAAGKGTRMRSDLPKVLHPVAGKPMLRWVVEAARAARCDQVVVIVGHGAEQVRSEFAGDDLAWVVQEEQKGTGHALAQVQPVVAEEALLLVLSGDVPLVQPATLDRLAAAADTGWGALATAWLEQPGSLGRVIGQDGVLERIVEAADADDEELAVGDVNSGLYALPAPSIFHYLAELKPDNAKGEFYLTDAVTAAVASGEKVRLVELEDLAESLGANDRRDLARLHRAFLDRKIAQLQAAGVTILEPRRTSIEPSVQIDRDTVVHPQVSLSGETRVGAGCELRQGVWIRDSTIGDRVTVEPYSVLDQAEVEAGCSVGPFARLRPGATLGAGAKVGNFVEVKNSQLGEGAKAGHLAYLGDADVGRGANIGAGVITCNYDGERKHRTTVEDGAFVGSDTMLVAPVRVGKEATTGAGSVITSDVPEGALGIGRSRQRNLENWKKRRRSRETSEEKSRE